MPIKFRCSHCRQFLGISQDQAGAVVDCPACGRAVRVPRLDGTVDPIPEPALNLGDSRLAAALDELASMGEAKLDEPHPLPEPDEGDQSNGQVTVLGPAPKPEPIPVAPLQPAAPIPLEPAKVAYSHETAAPLASPLPDSNSENSKENSKRASSVSGEKGAEDVLAELTARPVAIPEPHGAASWRRSEWWRALVTAPILAVLGGVALLFFGLGYFTANQVGRGERARMPANGVAAERRGNAGELGESEFTAGLRGRISYRTPEGENRPDRGARVIVLPKRSSPDGNDEDEARLSIVGLRSGDDVAEFEQAAARLQAVGGNAAIVDQTGRFELALPAAGNYHVLVLSRYHPRDESETLPSGLRRLLERYFDRPQHLLGQVGVQFGELRYRGSGIEIWDHTFTGR